MSDHSSIEWTGATWNPLLGCDKVSDGCKYCYAIVQCWMKQHHPNPKIAAAFAGLVEQLADGSLNWTGKVVCLPERLEQPLRWREPRRIFVNSMSDLFHEDVPDEFIAQVFAVMTLAGRHTFQVLTKRPERMRALMCDSARDGFAGAVTDAGLEMVGPPWSFLKAQPGPDEPHNWPPRNIWLGTSVEDQRAADERIPLLLQTPAAVRFLSCEPLLGPVELNLAERDPNWSDGYLFRAPRIGEHLHWVIAGGESGPKARPMHPDWARSLRAQCQTAGVAYFMKQWGEWAPAEDVQPDLRERAAERYVGQQWMCRVGKHAAGRVLDGRTWDEFPETARTLVSSHGVERQ